MRASARLSRSCATAAAADRTEHDALILDCVRAYATLGEICDELRAVYGTYEEPHFDE